MIVQVLHYLAESHNEAIYKEILERGVEGAHVQAKNEDGLSPLHLAVRKLVPRSIEDSGKYRCLVDVQVGTVSSAHFALTPFRRKLFPGRIHFGEAMNRETVLHTCRYIQ